jgi:tellurite resistance protein TehA-like permease
MFDQIYKTIFTGLILVLISSTMLYVDMRSSVVYAFLDIGFFLIGVGVLLGFFKMEPESKE